MSLEIPALESTSSSQSNMTACSGVSHQPTPLLEHMKHTKPFLGKAICEGDSGELTCPPGRVINVVGGFYGRKNNYECRNGNYDINSPAMNPQEPCIGPVKPLVANMLANPALGYSSKKCNLIKFTF